MAQFNKTLGRFQLAGIPPAPRGVPQIEVTFDIDANGIVHVSAKDQATGNEQKVSITASTNLSEDDINQAIKDAEAHAAEDQKRKEEIEVKNEAESLVYNTQKTIDELGDKLSGEEKSKIETEIENVKKLLDDHKSADEIKEGAEKLKNTLFSVSEKLYKSAGEAAANDTAGFGAGSTESTTNEDGTINAEYNVEDENKNDSDDENK